MNVIRLCTNINLNPSYRQIEGGREMKIMRRYICINMNMEIGRKIKMVTYIDIIINIIYVCVLIIFIVLSISIYIYIYIYMKRKRERDMDVKNICIYIYTWVCGDRGRER